MGLPSLLKGPPSLTLGPEANQPTPFAFRSDGRFHSYSKVLRLNKRMYVCDSFIEIQLHTSLREPVIT